MAKVKAADFDAFKKRCADAGAPFVDDDDPILKKGISIHFLGRETKPESEKKEDEKKKE